MHWYSTHKHIECACTNTRKSHEGSNISSIKPQQSLHTAAPLAGRDGDKQTALRRRFAVRHKTGSKKTACWEGTAGLDTEWGERREKGREKAGTRTRLASKTNRPHKPVSHQLCGLCPRAVRVCVCVCRCSYYRASRGKQYARSYFNTSVRHDLVVCTLKYGTTVWTEERKKERKKEGKKERKKEQKNKRAKE